MNKNESQIDLSGMISIPYLKKTTFTGSHKGMNFMLRKQSGEDGDQIQTVLWPGPFMFSATKEEKKVSRTFPFSQDGILEAVAWLNEYYETVYLRSNL